MERRSLKASQLMRQQVLCVVVVTSDDMQETSKRSTINNSQTIQAPKAYFPEDFKTMAMMMNDVDEQ
jgi:hypothetical protein